MEIFRKILYLTNVSVGTCVNILVIAAIIYGRFHKQKLFTFVLNLFISNLLFCTIGITISTTALFLPKGSMCPFSGFLVCSLSGITYWSIALVSINRYVFIVHFTHFDAIFSPRKTGIILLISWLYYPIIFSLPMIGIWGRYDFVGNRQVCSPMTSKEGFRLFVLVSIFITVLPIAFCYFAILWKVKRTTNRVDIVGRDLSTRHQRERQLAFSIILIISIFTALPIPYIVTTVMDPNMIKISAWIHVVAFNLLMSSFWVNTLTYSLMNQQIKICILKMIKNGFKTKESHSNAQTMTVNILSQ